ncbi:MAG: ATP-binding cassette domain-containing protein [Pirellulaceae bacterium]|nr:ATP-binding cassette domain-containing protein [Pirellulaceae bacterium]
MINSISPLDADNSGILVFKDLHKRFGDIAVLKGVSGKLVPGQISAFVGPNGAGKTTLFQLLTGELKPDRGSATLNGQNILGSSPYRLAGRGIGKLFQDVRAFPNLSILDNVIVAIVARQSYRDKPFDFGLVRNGRSQVLAKKAREYLSRVGFDANEEALAKNLSWGNQKLLALARLLAGEFRCVFLDEPIAGISTLMANRMVPLIRELAEAGVAVALIEHEITFVESLANDVIVMNEGVVIDSGSASEVLSHAETREICLGL